MDLHQTGPVGEGSDHLQLIKLWPSCTSGKGVCSGAKIFGSAPPYYSQRAVFASLRALFHVFIEKRGCRGVSQSRLSWAAYSSWGTHIVQPSYKCFCCHNTRWTLLDFCSLSLYLGNEIFDVHAMQLQGDYNHLFVRQGTGLQGQSIFKTKLTFRFVPLMCSFT